MPETRKQYDREFVKGLSGSSRRRASRSRRATCDLGIGLGTLGNGFANWDGPVMVDI